MTNLNLRVGSFYRNKLGETYVVVSEIKESFAGYQQGFRYWVTKLHHHAPVLETVTSNGYFDAISLEQQETDLIYEVILQ